MTRTERPAGGGVGRIVRGPVALLAAAAIQACGSLTVTPTAPTTVSGSGTVTIALSGTLVDGGTFEGFVTYGGRDIDDRPTFGRYRGGTWHVVVHGGSATGEVTFSNERGGRVSIETYRTPIPAIGIVVLWPDTDPAEESFTPHVTPRPAYDPDVQPTLRDFGGLIPGQLERTFGAFDDGQGGRTLIASIALR